VEDRYVEEIEEEINLLDYWLIIWNRKVLIILLVIVSVFATAIRSLFMVNIYKSEAVITSVAQGETGGGGVSALVSRFGGIPGMAVPGSSSSSEIINLLKSKILREKIIKRYDLLPVFFPEQWDEVKDDWKEGDEERGFTLNPFVFIRGFVERATHDAPINHGDKEKGEKKGPTVWDGLRALNSIVSVGSNIKDNTITVSIEFYDPEMAAKMVDYFLVALLDHMTSEAKRAAMINKKYLDEQLARTSDPLIRQKVYNLIAQQIEAAMMSEVKENFAFKIIDPPRVPDRRIKPGRTRMVMLSFVVSLFMGIFLAFFLEFIKNAKAERDISRKATN